MESIQNLLHQIQRMQWSDYLDIAVVAFLIYKILPLIKTPSTTRIAKAVVAVLIIAWLTDFLHLYTVGFIMNQFLAIGLLALVILFQPELRRMLVKNLTAAGYTVDGVPDGAEALAYLDAAAYDAAVLDIMMPKVDGLTVLRTLRARGSALPAAADSPGRRSRPGRRTRRGRRRLPHQALCHGRAAGAAAGADPEKGKRQYQRLHSGRSDGGHCRPDGEAW